MAGPVVAAAVILCRGRRLRGLADSKLLSEPRRERLYEAIRARSLVWAVAWADAAEIDRLNILQATLLAMRRAILRLPSWPAVVEVDGDRLPDLEFGCFSPSGRAVIGGDGSVAAISAASIVAKVTRDRMMRDLDRQFPHYGFARHKGYATEEHRACLDRYGPCRHHRRSFEPLRSMIVCGRMV
ncbi:MAG: ribonuclease HII [Woeseiaceae bacterium]